MKGKSLVWIFVLMISLLCQGRSDAYSTSVHRRITEEVIDRNIVKLNGYLKEAGFIRGVNENIMNKQIRRW